MRCSSPRRVTIKGLLLGGGAVLILLLLFSALSVIAPGGRDGGNAGKLPSKSERFGSPGGVAGLVDAPVEEAGRPVTGLDPEVGPQPGSRTVGEDAARSAGRAGGAAEDGLDANGSASNLARLRRKLLERAGFLALHGEDPAKNLVLVAQTFHRSGDHKAAMLWFEKARRMATDPDNTTNSSVALRAVVKGLLAVGEFREAEMLVGQIPLEKERERARAEVATSLARKKYFAEAVRIASGLRDPQARALGLRGIADAQARSGELDEAVNTVNAIPARWRDDAWMRVALARAGKGDAAGAAMLLGRIANDRTRDLASMRVAEAQARSGGTGSVEILLAALNDPQLRDASLRRVVEARVARMDYARAEDSVHWIVNANDRALAMEALVGLQVQSGDLSGAFLRARDIELPEPRARALRRVAIGLTSREGAGAGRRVAELINNDRERDLTYRRVAERSASMGRPGEALETVYLIRQPDERASALAELARWRARRGAMSPARLLLQDAVREVEQIPKVKHQERALGLLATAYAEARDSTAAMSTAASIRNTGLRDRAYQQLSRKFAALSDIQLAEQSALAIRKEETRERALDTMAQMIAGKTPPNRALGVVGKFESRRQQVKFLVTVAGRI